MSTKGQFKEAIDTIESTYDELDRDTQNVSENAVMLLEAVVRELDVQDVEDLEDRAGVQRGAFDPNTAVSSGSARLDEDLS